MWHDGAEWFSVWHGWGMIFWLLCIVFLIWLVSRLFSKGTSSGQANSNSNSAQGLLDERFAKGEIDEAEYQRRKAVLERKG